MVSVFFRLNHDSTCWKPEIARLWITGQPVEIHETHSNNGKFPIYYRDLLPSTVGKIIFQVLHVVSWVKASTTGLVKPTMPPFTPPCPTSAVYGMEGPCYFPSYQVGAITIWRTFCRGDHRRDNERQRMVFVLRRGFPNDFWDQEKESFTLQGTNISHLGKRKISFKSGLLGDMLIPWREGFPIALLCSWWCFLLSNIVNEQIWGNFSQMFGSFSKPSTRKSKTNTWNLKHGFRNGWPSIGCWTKSFLWDMVWISPNIHLKKTVWLWTFQGMNRFFVREKIWRNPPSTGTEALFLAVWPWLRSLTWCSCRGWKPCKGRGYETLLKSPEEPLNPEKFDGWWVFRDKVLSDLMGPFERCWSVGELIHLAKSLLSFFSVFSIWNDVKSPHVQV